MTEIQHLPIKSLQTLENNPRTIDKEQFAKLLKSLQEDPTFFECRPCLVNLEPDGTKRIYAGHQRLKAAKKLGWKQVPCVVSSNLDEKVMQERIIKDNMHYGEFDLDLAFSLFEVDTLLSAGFTNEQLTGEFDNIENLEEKPKKKSKSISICPQCGFES